MPPCRISNSRVTSGNESRLSSLSCPHTSQRGCTKIYVNYNLCRTTPWTPFHRKFARELVYNRWYQLTKHIVDEHIKPYVCKNSRIIVFSISWWLLLVSAISLPTKVCTRPQLSTKPIVTHKMHWQEKWVKNNAKSSIDTLAVSANMYIKSHTWNHY
jgi:hypothetical protein